MCLARAVTGPERFKGGTCSFGAPASGGDSPARIRTAGMQLARTSLHASGTGGRAASAAPVTAPFVTGLWQDEHQNKRDTSLPSLYARWGGEPLDPGGGRSR